MGKREVEEQGLKLAHCAVGFLMRIALLWSIIFIIELNTVGSITNSLVSAGLIL